MDINKLQKKTNELSYLNNSKIDDLNIFLENSKNICETLSNNKINKKINNNRKYNSEYRKKIILKFENIKNKNILIDIYNIINNDIGNNYSSNRNGIFINLNIVSDTCIDYLNEYIENYLNNNNLNNNLNYNLNNNLNNILSDTKTDKINCKIYKFDDIELISELGHKLSNQEKHIIKRIRK
jgi:hypothetical protein